MKISTGSRTLTLTLGIIFTSLLHVTKSYAQFTTGNLVVLQVSDGVTTLTNTGNPIILREFTPAGTPAFSVNVPTTGTNAIIVSGAATSEGALSLSSNNSYLVFGGYAQGMTNTVSLASSTTIQRAVCAVSAAGNYSMVASSASFHTGNNIRAAASDGSNNYWSAGGNDGTDYFGTASPTTNVQSTTANTRCINIFNNSLFFSTGSGTRGIYKVGTGLPVSSSQTNSLMVDVSTSSTSSSPSPYAFSFNPAMTICYIADDRSTSTGGGIQKWVYASSTWSLAYTLGTGSTSTSGARGVAVNFSGTNPVIYATTAESTGNRIISMVDAGASSSATTLATASANAIFRGIAFSPSPSCNTPSIASVTSNGTLCAGQTLSLTANVTGTSAVSYSWTGTGTISSPTSSNITVAGAVSGIYTVVATNTCGSSSSSLSVTVMPAPTISVTSSTTSVCPGQTVALTASGATSYTWSNGISNGGVFSPTATAVYTATGSLNNCSGTSTVSILVNPLPALNAGSITICSGQPGTLTASGAASYSWSTGSTSPSIAVTQTVTQSYTVTGTSAAGCILTLTTQVAVTNSPVIVINSTSVCAGSSATLIAGGANSFTWSTGASTGSIVVSPTATSVYSVSGSLAGCAGVASNTAAVSVIPVPVLSVSGNSMACAGSVVSQTLSGAASYSLNGNATNAVISLTPVSTSTYSILGLAANGCSATLTGTIASAPLPTLSIVGNTAACSGSALTQTLSGAASYSLNGSATSSVITLTPTSVLNYSITGVSANGCTATAIRTITALPLPTIAISGNTVVCSGSAISQTLSGASSYSLNGSASASIISFTPANTTSYTVTGNSSNGCQGMVTRTIAVNALPVLTLSSSSPTLCSGTSATLTVSGAATYTWSAGAGSGASIVVTPSANTTYSVTGSSTNNCTSTSLFVQNVSACTSVSELSKVADINLYPNPAGSFTSIDNLDSERNEIRFVNALGSTVLVEKNYSSTHTIDLSGLPNGVYLVQIASGGKLSVKKLVIDK